jgi:glyoxalase family protein
MAAPISGIHHVTAIAGHPQKTLDFYADVIGLRLVKLTVNHDDPGTYHLYFGDEAGRPGTLITFFPRPGAPRGRVGPGQAAAVSFSVPAGAVGYWMDRFLHRGVPFETPRERFEEEEVLALSDPDGVRLEMVGHLFPYEVAGREGGPVPAEHAVRGLYGVTLAEGALDPTASFLTEALDFAFIGEEDGRFRYAAGAGGPGGLVDLVPAPDARAGRISAGTVHHVAWRANNEEAQREWREKIVAAGAGVTPVIDRTYFRSIYFREPGGALFEIATDPPGFAVDEPEDRLGSELVLPPWLSPARVRIEAALPPLKLPKAA